MWPSLKQVGEITAAGLNSSHGLFGAEVVSALYLSSPPSLFKHLKKQSHQWSKGSASEHLLPLHVVLKQQAHCTIWPPLLS